MPVVFEHFQAHKQKNKSISFIGFLYGHYSNTQDDDGDDEQDRQLPFKSHNTGSLAALFIFTGALPQSYNISPPVPDVNEHFFLQAQFLPATFNTTIWQPPRQSC